MGVQKGCLKGVFEGGVQRGCLEWVFERAV